MINESVMLFIFIIKEAEEAIGKESRSVGK